MGAYYYVGLMAHLVQDKAVPAHAANIYHPLPRYDGLEYWASSQQYGPANGTLGKKLGSNPLTYYYDKENPNPSIVRNTQLKLPSWTWPGGFQFFLYNPDYWKTRQYWYLNELAEPYTGDGFVGNLSNTTQAGGWGHYGGVNAEDFYTYQPLPFVTITASPTIATDQINEAASYTAGMLMAVSKSLPPIVKDLSLSEPNLVVGQPVQINFTVLENRTSTVKLYITVDGEDGTPIISAEYKTGVDIGALYNVPDSEVNALPFARAFSISWDGKMSGDTELDSRPHKLYVRASDADGNFSDAAVVEFFVDAGGPRVSVGNMVSTFYADFQGVNRVSPAGTNPAMLATAGVDMQLLVRDESSGVKSIKLSKLEAIGDSTGTVVYSKLFSEPTGLYAEPALPLLADGPYRLESEDWDGNRTVAPFQLGSIESPSVIAESPVVYHPAADNYDVTLRVAAKSSYTLKKMELLGDDEAVLETRALDVTQSSQAFTIRGILSAVTPGAYEKTYYTRTADASGQTLSQYKIFQAATKDAPLAGAVREKSSPVMDLTALGLLPGGAAVLQDSPNFWGSLYYYYRERSDQSGPITTAPPPTAQVQIYVQTGDTPMALGAESLVYSRTDFTRLIQAGDTVPPGCNGEGGTVPADTRVACFVSVTSAIPLKRYVKVHAVGTQEQPDGIYSCYQLSIDNPDYCLRGSKYPELVLSGSLSGMIRGLSHGDSMASLTGAPGTYLAAGQNVSVNLGDILTVAFDNVAQPGYLSAAFVTPQGYPGLAPLASFLLNAPAPVSYSGQIRFAVKYPSGLTAGQQGGITAYQIVIDPESGIRLMKPLAAQINTAAKEVSFYADSLGEFLVAAPKYTTPWTLESAPAPDGQPELSAVSNNGALSQRRLEPGSQEARDAGALLAGMNLFPAGNIFHVGPDDTALEPAAALKMRYTDADLADRGLTESELGLYEFSADAKVMMKLPNQLLDPVRNEITGEVPHLYSLFAILGSSRGEQVPLGDDTTPPVTNAVPGVPPYQSGGMVFVSTAADIYLDAYDPEVAGAATSGVDNTDYVLDLAEGQPEVPVLYAGPLRLSEGMHTLGFASRDKRGNDEEKRTATFYADGTPPVSTCAVLGEGSADNGNLVLVEGSSIAISAVDPESQGFASGLGMIVFDISTSPCTGFSDYPSAPGQCRKLLYTGAFSLGVGTHTLYYAAMDNVGNASAIRGVLVTVVARTYDNPASWPHYEYLNEFDAGGYSGYQTFDENGNLLLYQNYGLRKYTADGAYLATIGQNQILSPNSLAVCSNGSIWVDDYDYTQSGHRLKKFSREGALVSDVNITPSYERNAFQLFVACGPENSPYILSYELPSWTPYIYKFDSTGNYVGRLPYPLPKGVLQFVNDKRGDFYTRSSTSVYKFSSSGQLLMEWPMSDSSRGAISPDNFGNIYLWNRQSNMVEVYASTGGIIASFRDLPSGYSIKRLVSPGFPLIHPETGRIYMPDENRMKVYGLDHTPPASPVIHSPYNSQAVYTTTPLILGRAEALSSLELYNSGGLIGTLTADGEGWLNGASLPLGQGLNSLKFRSKDVAGNTSDFSPVTEVSVKTNFREVSFGAAIAGPPNPPDYSWNVIDTSATVLGDFDRDGRKDVVGFSRRAEYTLYKGNGDGTFEHVYTKGIPGMDFYSGGDDAVTADFNGDGLLDIAVSIYIARYPYTDSVLMLLAGNGDGTFSEPLLLDHLIGYSGLGLGDFNGDGYPDIGGASGADIKVYLGGPGGFFLSISTPIPSGLPATRGGGVAITDIDQDGRPDILFRNVVLYGNGEGGFEQMSILPYFSTYTDAADVGKSIISDFNSDGVNDIGLVSEEEFGVYLGLGGRTFRKVQSVGWWSLYGGVSGDFNRDGVPDVALSPYQVQSVHVLAGRGDGTFTDRVMLPTGGTSLYGNLAGSILADDINADGKTDILQASSEMSMGGGKYVNTFFAFLNTTSAPDTMPPGVAVISASNTPEGAVALSWTAPGNDGSLGSAGSYDLRYGFNEITDDAAFNSAERWTLPAPKPAGLVERFIFENLEGGATYYFALKTYDAAGNVSALSNSPWVRTNYVVRTPQTVDGNPELEMVSSKLTYIAQISTISGPGAVAIGTAAAQVLTISSNMYEISPEGDYNPPAALTFYYSTAAIAAVGLSEEDVFVYEHFEGSGWVKLAGQVKDTLNHKITVPISRIASLFGIFGVVKDRTAPVTDCSVVGSSWPYSGGVYVSSSSSITLSASDPVVFGTSSGVGFTGFRVDAATSAPFETYVEPFRLSTGAHRVEFRSSDKAGNMEDSDLLSVIVDGETPIVSYIVAGSSFAAVNVMYVAAGSTITLVSSDTASGVSALSYAVNGSTSSVSSGIAEIYLSSAGAYAIGYSAGDNVGNGMAHGLLSVYVDTTAPVSALLLSGSHEIAPWYTSGVVAELSSSDMASGARRTLYSLDGSSFAVYAATFPVLSEGGHSLEFYSIDNVLNAENPRSVHFGIDLSTPEASYALMPVPNADGWNNAAVNVVFTGTDVVSGLAYCSSSFTVTGEGAGIPVSGYCSDYAGWTSTAVFALNIDTTAPLSQAGLVAVAGRNGWLVSPAVVQVTSTDSLSGVNGLYYSLDGSSFTLYSSSFPVTGEGEHRLKYYAVDKAGNTEAKKSLEFKLDLAAPVVVTVSSPAANDLGWNNTAVTAVFSGTDAVSGLAYCEPEKLLALEGHSLPVSGYCMDHAGWTSTATVVVSIDTTAPVAAYSAAPAANEEGWNNTDVTLKFSCEDALSGIKTCPKDIILAAEGAGISISTSVKDNADNSASMTVAGIKIDRTAPVSTAAISGVSVNGWYSSAIDIVIASSDALSGIKGISYSLDGGEYLSYVSPLAVAAEGAHTLKYYAVDNAGNTESEKSMEFSIDSSMPEVTYSQIPIPNGEGWNNTSVQVVFAASDTVSGVMSCSSAAVTLEGAGHSVTGWCKDMAGNIAFATATVNIDLTRPAVSGAAVPAPNEAGWNNGDVAVEFTCSDELSGIDVCPENILMVTEGVGLSTSAFAYDLAGNMGSAEVAGVKIDRTSPVSTAALTGVHRNGWYSSPVEVVLASTDALAGIKEVLYSLDGKEYAIYSMPLHVPGDGDHSLKYYALDNAGNMEAAKSVEFKIDASRPEITYSQAPGANVKGWNNTSVQVVFSGSDTLSGIEACSSTTIAMEGAVQRVPGWCRDVAGNMAYATATLSIDLTNPDASAAVQPPPNAYGWHNGPVEVGFTGVDALSGLASCESPRTISIQGSSMPVSGSCVDNAGNSSSAALAVSIDTAAPSLSYSARPAPNAAGWNNTAVSMEFTCSDLLSGVRYCPGAITLAEEGAAISTAAAAYDYAGNGQQVEVSGIKIDKTAPVTRAELSGTLENGWYNTSVTLSLPAVDVLSGLSGISYRVEGPGYSAGELAYGAPVVFEADGRYTVYFYAMDKAGNREAEKSVSFKIDREIPAISYALEPAANPAGWNNASVRVVFSGVDALSGLKECSTATVSIEGAGQKVVGHCSDNAGNVAYATATVNVDLTAAAIELNSPLAGQTYIATRGKIGVDFAVTDNLDPAPGAEAFLVQVEDRGSPRGGRPARIAVASGQSIEPLDIDDGLWRLAVSATDFADNAAYAEGGAFDVIHDVLAPRSALVTSGPVYRPAGGTYLTSAALFNLSSIDDLVAVADGIGLGVKNQSAMLKSGEQTVKELSFMNPLPKQGAAFASTFGFASLGTLADGLYSLTYRAEDTLANAELPKIMSFSLDNTPPFTGFNVTGASYETQDKMFITGTSGLALAGVDVSSGGVASGLMLTKYKLDEGAWQVYAGSFSVTAEGLHSLAYYSLDHVQNIEASRTRSVVVDNTPPAAYITLGAPMFEAFGVPVITPETPLALSAADHAAAGLASGLKSIHYELINPAGGSSGVLNYTEPFRIAGQGTYIVRCWAADNVGNIGSPAELKVAVTGLQHDALIASNGLDMSGSADILGRVEAGIAGLNGNARILGDVYASTITLKGKAQITGLQAALAAGFATEPVEMAYIVARASAVNNNALVPARYIADGRLVVSANAELTLSTGVYYFTGLDLAGGAKIILDGKVEILVAGDVAIAGGSSFNVAGAASGANIFLSTRSALTFTGGGSLAANVYAPYSDLKLTGNALLGGHYFVRTAILSGTGNIIQAGETLPKTASATEDTGGKKRVSALAAGDTAYSVLSGPDPAFRLGEVYVYPNPALRGAAPVLHIETGIADRVKISIYTVSGRQAHEHTLTGMPVALDDGNGLSYAYEYAWRDSVPSGVYYYHIEAEKGGQKIRKSGKFAVVR